MWFNKQIFEKGFWNSLNGNKSIFVVTFLLGTTFLLSFAPHPYHVSYTEIEYKKTDNTMTFSVEVFTDDLESGIKLNYQPEKFQLSTSNIDSTNERLIQKYILDHFNIILDGIVFKQIEFLPTESNPDRTVIYFQITNLPPFHGLTLYSELLTSLFNDQQNIVEFKYNSTTEKALLTKAKKNVTWKLN
ncbi:MAG: DUF6702 family protein [Salibacteraceae bacterium]